MSYPTSSVRWLYKLVESAPRDLADLAREHGVLRSAQATRAKALGPHLVSRLAAVTIASEKLSSTVAGRL